MRIITGKARGTKLFTPSNYDVRPTADRVKESVFNILANRFFNAKILDAFAGTGNLGLEAWSRGASQVIFLDKNRQSLNLVQKNIAKCYAENECQIMQGDSIGLVQKLAGKYLFDVIFLDPPYNKGLIDLFLQAVAKNNILTPNGLIVAELAANEIVNLPQNFQLLREEKYGSTKVFFIGLVKK